VAEVNLGRPDQPLVGPVLVVWSGEELVMGSWLREAEPSLGGRALCLNCRLLKLGAFG
jgi:hypothetical protein